MGIGGSISGRGSARAGALRLERPADGSEEGIVERGGERQAMEQEVGGSWEPCRVG